VFGGWEEKGPSAAGPTQGHQFYLRGPGKSELRSEDELEKIEERVKEVHSGWKKSRDTGKNAGNTVAQWELLEA
jgi:hypothetical protein